MYIHLSSTSKYTHLCALYNTEEIVVCQIFLLHFKSSWTKTACGFVRHTLQWQHAKAQYGKHIHAKLLVVKYC